MYLCGSHIYLHATKMNRRGTIIAGDRLEKIHICAATIHLGAVETHHGARELGI
jgi:hypothetical protein